MWEIERSVALGQGFFQNILRGPFETQNGVGKDLKSAHLSGAGDESNSVTVFHSNGVDGAFCCFLGRYALPFGFDDDLHFICLALRHGRFCGFLPMYM